MENVNEMQVLSGMEINEDKKKRILELFKSLKELDACIEPFAEQKKELRVLYTKDNDWLSNDEYGMVKKAYNAIKKNLNLDDLAVLVEIGKAEVQPDPLPDGGTVGDDE